MKSRNGNGGNGGPNYNVGEQHDSIMLNYYAGSSATDCWARPNPKSTAYKAWLDDVVVSNTARVGCPVQ